MDLTRVQPRSGMSTMDDYLGCGCAIYACGYLNGDETWYQSESDVIGSVSYDPNTEFVVLVHGYGAAPRYGRNSFVNEWLYDEYAGTHTVLLEVTLTYTIPGAQSATKQLLYEQKTMAPSRSQDYPFSSSTKGSDALTTGGSSPILYIKLPKAAASYQVEMNARVHFTDLVSEGFTDLTDSFTITVPGLPTYWMHYAWSGSSWYDYSNMPPSQYKTHGISTTVSSIVPSMVDHIFYRWYYYLYDASGHIIEGSKGYADPGDAWSIDSNVYFYTDWKEVPKITNVTTSRCTASGVETDGGGYLKATVGYSVDSQWKTGSSITMSIGSASATVQLSSRTGTVNISPINISARPDATYAVQFELEDGAGHTATKVVSDSVTYSAPSAENIVVNRCGSNGTISDDGVYGYLDLNWFVANTKDASASDVVSPTSIRVTSTATDATTTSFSAGSISGDKRTGSFSLLIGSGLSLGPFDPGVSYEITVIISDPWNSTTYKVTLPQAFFTIDLLGDTYLQSDGQRPGHGIAFGKPAFREGMDVAMQAYFASAVKVAERLSLPVYEYATKPNESDVPSKPSLVVTEDKEVWLVIPDPS